jgi:DNA-binding NarL/FixJ family response regulator
MFDLLKDFLPGAPDAGSAFSELTRREREVLDLIARGLDNMQIAARLEVAEKTVRNHITQIFAKMAVESRAQAIVRALEAGFGR